MKKAMKFTLVVAGVDEDAMGDAIAEATRLMKEGNWSGVNSNDSSAFRFDSTNIVHDSELPAGC